MSDTAAPSTSAPPVAGYRSPLSPDFIMIGAVPENGLRDVRARLLGARIDTRALASDVGIRPAAAAAGLSFVFRYGVAVTFGPDAQAPDALDRALRVHVIDPTNVHSGAQEYEVADLAFRSGGQSGGQDSIGPGGHILLVDASPERLLLVATVLARSVVLARDEVLVSEAFHQIDPLVSELRQNGRSRLPIREAMKLVGNVLAARHRMVGTVQVDERPDLLWDHPGLDRLYARLEAEYELKERADVLDRKFASLGDFTEVLLDIVQGIRSVRLEVAIVALFALEIVLTLYSMLH